MEWLERRALLSTTSAVSYQVGPFTHSALYAIGPNDNVEVSIDGGSFTNLGGYAKQISAGVNATFGPRVYAIGLDDALYFDFGLGFIRQGGYVTEVNTPAVGVALPSDLTYVVGLGHVGYLHQGTTFSPIGGGTIE
jgi:hypothetical protein